MSEEIRPPPRRRSFLLSRPSLNNYIRTISQYVTNSRKMFADRTIISHQVAALSTATAQKKYANGLKDALNAVVAGSLPAPVMSLQVRRVTFEADR